MAVVIEKAQALRVKFENNDTEFRIDESPRFRRWNISRMGTRKAKVFSLPVRAREHLCLQGNGRLIRIFIHLSRAHSSLRELGYGYVREGSCFHPMCPSRPSPVPRSSAVLRFSWALINLVHLSHLLRSSFVLKHGGPAAAWAIERRKGVARIT